MKYGLYYFVRSIAEITFRAFFRSVHIEGIEKVPKGKPVLLAASHAGSFLDGIVMEYISSYKVFTLVRGDAFNKAIFNRVLRSLLLLPIYRARDAEAEKARKGNATTFDECYELFKKDAKILIFSEGIAYPEKATRKLKKGTAAMAADMIARSDGGMDIYIIPVGLNYSQFFKLRTALQVNYGEPIRMLDYLEEMKEDERAFAVNFTHLLQEKLDALVVNTKGQFHESKELAQEILINEYDKRSFFWQKNTGSESIVKAVQNVNADNSDAILEYDAALKKHGLSDRNLSSNHINFIAILTALLTSAMSIPAALVYALMWMWAKRFTQKKVKSEVLLDSVYFGLGQVSTVIWYILLIIVVFVFLPSEWTVIWKIIAFFSAVIGTAAWFATADEIPHIWKSLKYLSLSREKRQQLKSMRSSILNSMK